MFIRIWQFRVPLDNADEFQAIYGPEGDWARLFRREVGLLRSTTHPNIFISIDRWVSPEAWAAFLRSWGADYTGLDQRCERLTVSEGEIGSFRSAGVGGG